MPLFWKHKGESQRAWSRAGKIRVCILALALNCVTWRNPFTSLSLSFLVGKMDYNFPVEPLGNKTRPYK